MQRLHGADVDPSRHRPTLRTGFPIVTVKDWVRSQACLANRLGVDRWAAIIGGSLGGMQALQWAIDYPERVRHAIAIAAAPARRRKISLSTRWPDARFSRPEFHQGNYYAHNVVPRRGLMIARMLGHITYLSDEGMRAKFGRELREGKLNYNYESEFQVESYLRYQGYSFVDRFDANTYLLMTKALDYFDPAADFDNDLSAAFRRAQARFLVIAFTSDWRFAPDRSREIVKALVDAKRGSAMPKLRPPTAMTPFNAHPPLPGNIQCLHGPGG
ncbi:MAG: alpha/beta fold hydrolase [Candidatus Competibacteraceae bacterium]